MATNSNYWYNKAEMPKREKNKIAKMVRGTIVDYISIGGEDVALLEVEADIFKKVFIANRRFLYNGEYTAPPDENDYSNASCYLTQDGLGGFAITTSGWLVSVFSNYFVKGFSQAIKKHILPRAYKLVCIVSKDNQGHSLVDLYEKQFHFRVYATTIDDEMIMRQYYGDEFIDSFVQGQGKPYHVFMIGEHAEGENPTILHFEDYFEAEEYVDRTVHLKEE